MDLGKKIMTMRNEKNLSQEQLAEKLNVTRQTISNWENGKFYPDIDSLVNLSKFFNVSLDDLLSYDDKVLDYLKDSTDIVKSNKNILYAVLLNILLIIAFIIVGIIFNESASIIIMNYIFMAIFIAIYLVGAVSMVYQLYKITIIDAKARGLKHPKLMGLLTTSGQSSEGLILYLLKRRKYPIKNITDSEKEEISKRKRIILVGIIFMVIGAIGFVYVLIPKI